jgi:hypothetical protein
MSLTNLKYRGGTPWSKAHDPEGNMEAIDAKMSETTAATAAAAANTLKTAMLTNATAGTGASLALAEPTGGGTSTVTLTAPALTADRDVTFPNTDVDLTDIGTNTTAISNLTDGTTARTGEIQNTQNVGTAGTGVTAEEFGDGRQHTTVLDISGVTFTVAAAANEAIGALVYTFPAGVHLHKISYMDVALQGTGTVDADTPEVGIGSTEATGAHAILSDVAATAEDYITGTAAADCNGTATEVVSVAVAGALAGISVNAAADTKTVYLNLAAGWNGADTLTTAGEIVLEWTTLA